jgi:hypothetical protein
VAQIQTVCSLEALVEKANELGVVCTGSRLAVSRAVLPVLLETADGGSRWFQTMQAANLRKVAYSPDRGGGGSSSSSGSGSDSGSGGGGCGGDDGKGGGGGEREEGAPLTPLQAAAQVEQAAWELENRLAQDERARVRRVLELRHDQARQVNSHAKFPRAGTAGGHARSALTDTVR